MGAERGIRNHLRREEMTRKNSQEEERDSGGKGAERGIRNHLRREEMT